MIYDEVKYIRRKHIDLVVRTAESVREHFHQEIELIYILSGTMVLHVGEQTSLMEAEDICVINANRKHGYTTSEDVLFVRVSVTYQLVSDVFRNEPLFFLCDSTREAGLERYDSLRGCMRLLLDHYLKSRGQRADFHYIALGYELLDVLATEFLMNPPEKKAGEDYDKLDVRIDQINNYIRANYSQPVSLKELSQKLYLSEGYLSRFFKRQYGMSFSDYLSNVRLHHAMEDLLYTDIPVTQIVYGNGFSNTTVFSKQFKAMYGDTPSEYRKKMKQKKISVSEPPPDTRIENMLWDYLKSKGNAADTLPGKRTLDGRCSVKGEATAFWPGFHTLNMGMASDLLKSEVQEHVILLNQMVGLKYIRFWNVFTPEMLMDINNEAAGFNFSRLDRILDFLIQQGLKPHMELGIKPRRVMKNLDIALNEDFDRERPYERDGVRVERWAEALGALMQHLAGRYSRALDTWRMELWFDERRWDMDGTMSEYFELFNITWEIVKKYSSKLELGGCGLKFDYQESEILVFLQAWKKQEHQPDFISALYYAYVRGTAIKSMSFRRSTDNTYMQHCIKKLKRLMDKAGMDNVPIYFTEWNMTVSDRNYINDTCFKGAYIVKNMLDNFDQLKEIVYFQGSDCVTEYYDSSTLLHGGTGLVSKDGILKPAGYAFRFLNQLHAQVVGRGENYIITTDMEDSFRILCHNQMNLNAAYYFTREDAVKKEVIAQYFEKTEKLSWTLTLTGVSEGLYRIKIFRLNENYGSILDHWRELDYAEDLSADEVRYFQKICSPHIAIRKAIVKGGELALDIVLDANEVAYIHIQRQP